MTQPRPGVDPQSEMGPPPGMDPHSETDTHSVGHPRRETEPGLAEPNPESDRQPDASARPPAADRPARGGGTLRGISSVAFGRRGIGPEDRSANVKHVRVEGTRDGRPLTLTYDFAVEQVGRSASSAIPGCAPTLGRWASWP